jgi:HAD superfamily hydrolase (TIGR01509 family)
MRQHDAWLVDLDGTLYQAMPLKLAMAAYLLVAGPQALKIIARFRKEHETIREQGLVCSPSPFAEQLARTAAALKLPLAEVEPIIQKYMFERPLPWLPRFKRKDLIEEITAFRNNGGRTAIVSDYPAQKKLAALGLTDLFDRVVASGEPGGPSKLKPSPDGYLLAAEVLGVEPSRCLVIGDRSDADGAAAIASGMEFRLIT